MNDSTSSSVRLTVWSCFCHESEACSLSSAASATPDRAEPSLAVTRRSARTPSSASLKATKSSSYCSIKPAAGAESVSDSHKICVQLCLDVHAFASELEAVGVSAKELPEYAQLQEAVRPDEGVVGSLGGQKEAAVS